MEYNLDNKDFLSFLLEIFPIDLKRYMDACLSTERLSSKLIQVIRYQDDVYGQSLILELYLSNIIRY